MLQRRARPEHIRVSLFDDATGATALVLPDRRMWPAGLIFAAFFAVFAGVEVMTLREMVTGRPVGSVFDLMFILFQGFWLLGWSVGVVILGLATVLFLFYRESARLQNGKLVLAPRLGPLNFILDYDLSKIRNIRVEKAGAQNLVRVRFDYGEGTASLGDTMSQSDAERLVGVMRNAATAAGLTARAPEAPRWQTATPVMRAPQVTPTPEALQPSTLPSTASPSALALIAANLLPLAGVLVFGWDLSEVIVLYWAESAVIAFYTVLKMAMVGKLAALFEVPFFIGHFGGFMAGHFLFIYAFFVRGIDPFGPEPGVREALLEIFNPLWMSLAGLFFSHGVSFVTNFVGRREYATATVSALMTAPYKRIVVMHLALIFGGWLIMAFKTPIWGLALLVLFKTMLDLSAHRQEHRVR
jgi:hypothetical protein